MNIKRTVMEVDSLALRQNLSQVRALAPESKVLAMVKSDAYGHGLRVVASALEAADGFGVSSVQEGMFLRKVLKVEKPIVLLNGFWEQQELEFCEAFEILPVIHQLEQLDMMAKFSFKNPFQIWLKVDTGMNRLGFSLEDLPMIWEKIKQMPWLQPVVLMTHLHSADLLESAATQEQIQRLQVLQDHMKLPVSISNSAGILAWPGLKNDWVRPGLMLYGVSPLFATPHANRMPKLSPVMQLKSTLLSVRHCRKGETVGYGGHWCCPEDMPIGVVAAGYRDGYPTSAPSGTPILVKGIRTQLVGRVSMEMLTVDLRGVPNAKVGDDVLLWGKGLPIEEIALKAQANVYELLMHARKGGFDRD